MTTTIISTPHDHLFRGAMQDLRVAKEFFAQHLPPIIKDKVDFDSLISLQNSYIDQKLKLSESDVLYQVTIAGESGYLYVLCEHQSEPDPLIAFRLWQYMIGIWRNHLRQQGKKATRLPLIVPMLFYTGEKKHNSHMDLRDLIQAPRELIDQILFQPFRLIDVNNIPDQELREHLWAGIMSFIMKHIRDRDTLLFLREIRQQLQQIEQQDGVDLLILLLNYVLAASEIEDFEDFVEFVQTDLSPVAGEKIMTLAERLREQGRREGLMLAEQFRTEGEAAVLIRQLTRKFGAIPANYQERIQQADAELLLVWCESLLEAKTITEVFRN